MITRAIQISLLSGLLLAPAVILAGPVPAPNATPVSKEGYSLVDALKELNAAHFSYIEEIHEIKPGEYKAEAMNSKGEVVEITVNLNDPSKSNVPVESTDIKYLTSLEVAQLVLKAGYKDISKIKCEQTYYSVTALDMNNSKVRLRINPTTGEISKGWSF